MNKWKLTKNTINGENFYAVIKLKNPSEPRHAGNIIYGCTWIRDFDAAFNFCDALNKEEDYGE